MRSIMLGALLLGMWAGSSLGDEGVAGPAEVVATVEAGSGEVQVHLEGPLSADLPFVRLLRLPSGAENPRVSPVASAAVDGIQVELGRPMVMRGLSLVPVIVTVDPTAPDGATAAESGVLDFRIEYDGEDLGARAGRGGGATEFSRGFFDAWGEYLLIDPTSRANLSTGDGGYLIVTVPEFVETLEPLIQWKREVGFDVMVVTTDEAGTRNDEIQEYIRDLYWTVDRPPQYVLIAGDVEQIPGFDYHQSVSDMPYVLVDGEDFLPDMEIGRLSAQNTTQLETIVAKILRYEQNPYQEDDEWFSRALLVAADYSSSTPVTVSRWCGSQLQDIGYAAVDSVYYPPHWSTGPPLIKRSIDQGVSLVSYRGWAYGWRGWQPPEFTVDDIPRLDNGWKLPAVFSFVCLNGNYVEPECFGESWIRAGSATAPKGAVAFLGNSEHWSHTRYNDTAAIGVFRAMRDRGVRRLGALLDALKFEIFTQFHEQLYYSEWQDNSVEFYFHIYGLLGDPSMEIWTAPPSPILVEHPADLPAGSTSLDIRVLGDDGLTPVEGARIGITRGETLLGSVRTRADGRANCLAEFSEGETPVTLTVTGTGLAPYRTTLEVVTDAPYLALEQVGIQDDGSNGSLGNGDGVPNPGEILAIEIGLRNLGPDMAVGTGAILESLWGALVTEGTAEYGAVPAGERTDPGSPFLVAISEKAEPGLRPRFRLVAENGGAPSVVGFELAVMAPSMSYEGHVLGGDGVLDPGEVVDLAVTLRNVGNRASSVSRCTLRSETPGLASVTMDSAEYPGALVDGTVSSPTSFQVQAEEAAAIGQAAVFTLTSTTSEGYVSETSFSLPMGSADHRAPLGPDAYGYWAYDNSDTDYPDAVPVYDWVTCSTTYGGSGTRLDLGDNTMVTVDLPFPFTYYGTSYEQLLVSDNGWVSFDTTTYRDFYNWAMPNTYGNGAQIAPFWDNLNPEKTHDGVLVGDGIYVLDDAENHRFVVEWSRIGNLRSQHDEEDRQDYDDLQTFEVVLFDPAYYPTPTEDGIIRFQYKQIVNNDVDRMFSTVGIENESEDVGLQYTYANAYPTSAAPLSAGLAIEFTTTPPRYQPFRLERFEVAPTAEGVRLNWEPCDERARGKYTVYRSSEGEAYRTLPGGRLDAATRSYLDTDADPEGHYTYWLGSSDPIGFETLLGPFQYPDTRASRIELGLRVGYPNPSDGGTNLVYSIPGPADTRLRIYDATGRMVRTLVDRPVEAGVWTVAWDGADDGGRAVPSGIYFGRLEVGRDLRSVKLTRVR